jgi:hypothetical protein
MNQARNRAVKLMQHYFTLCAKQSGVRWDSDNLAEIESIVDDLIDAAVEKMKEESVYAPEYGIEGAGLDRPTKF